MKTKIILLTAAVLATSFLGYKGIASFVANEKAAKSNPSNNIDGTTNRDGIVKAGSFEASNFANNIQDGQILQCFCWSYNEIANYIPKIASQGFTAIQTSPVQVCKEQTTDDGKGNARTAKDVWWAYYQPAAFTVDDTGDNALGTPEEFANMCNVAHQYGVKVMVDVVANHLGNQWVADSLCERSYLYEWEIAGMSKSAQDGGYIPYTGKYWAYGSNNAVDASNSKASDVKQIDTYYYKNTMKFHPYMVQDNDEAGNITKGNIGMMDLKTEDPVVQNAVAEYLEELIDYGVDGFRFDAAKHIETPYDEDSIKSDFWTNVLSRADKRASSYGKSMYYYGEILNRVGIGRKLSYYTNCGVAITDSGMGHNIVENGGSGFSSFNYAEGEDYGNYRKHMVTWAESHDNYMGTQDTHNKPESVINKSYAILGARKDFSTLYCARFADYEKSKLGSVATENGWSYDEIGAVNKFHNYYAKANANENCYMDNGYTIVERYNLGKSRDSGIVIVGNSGNCSVGTSYLADGQYVDQVTGNKFTVSGGRVSGTVGNTGIAVVYNKEYIPVVNPYINASKESCSFKTDSLTVNFTIGNAASATMSINGAAPVACSNNPTVEIKNLKNGESYVVTISINGVDGTTLTKTYKYTKIESVANISLYYKDVKNWNKVYAYCWGDNAKNASWPGVLLNKVGTDNGNNVYNINFDLENYSKIIFTNGNDQTVDISVDQNSKGFYITGNSNGKYTVSSYVYNPTPDPIPDPIEEKTIYFANTKNWSIVKAYVWGSNGALKSWPGTVMTYVGKDSNGTSIYSINVDLTKYSNIIFTNGSEQTIDLTINESTTGYQLSSKSGNKYTVASYIYNDEPTPIPTPVTEKTIYFTNTNNWTIVKAYVWGSNGALKSWPGTLMTYVGKDSNGKSVYSINVDLTKYNKIIFTNGSQQTVDIPIDSSSSGFYISGTSGNKLSVGTYTYSK